VGCLLDLPVIFLLLALFRSLREDDDRERGGSVPLFEELRIACDDCLLMLPARLPVRLGGGEEVEDTESVVLMRDFDAVGVAGGLMLVLLLLLRLSFLPVPVIDFCDEFAIEVESSPISGKTAETAIPAPPAAEDTPFILLLLPTRVVPCLESGEGGFKDGADNSATLATSAADDAPTEDMDALLPLRTEADAESTDLESLSESCESIDVAAKPMPPTLES